MFRVGGREIVNKYYIELRIRLCRFAGFAAFAVLLFRRCAVLPFRRFVVFMVLPLGGFHGSAVLAFCRFATHPPI